MISDSYESAATACGEIPFKVSDLHSIDAVAPAARCLKKMNNDSESSAEDLGSMMRALRHQVTQIGHGDFRGMSAVLVAQTHMLHRMFSRTVERYVDTETDAAVLYGHVALKAQAQCRDNIDSLQLYYRHTTCNG